MKAKLVKESLNEYMNDSLNNSLLNEARSLMVKAADDSKWTDFHEDDQYMSLEPIDVNHNEDMPWLQVEKNNLYVRWFTEAAESLRSVEDEYIILGSDYYQNSDSPNIIKLYERPDEEDVTMVITKRNLPAFNKLVKDIVYQILDCVDTMTSEDAYGVTDED